MSDLFHRLAATAVGQLPAVRPLIASRYEPGLEILVPNAEDPARSEPRAPELEPLTPASTVLTDMPAPADFRSPALRSESKDGDGMAQLIPEQQPSDSRRAAEVGRPAPDVTRHRGAVSATSPASVVGTKEPAGSEEMVLGHEISAGTPGDRARTAVRPPEARARHQSRADDVRALPAPRPLVTLAKSAVRVLPHLADSNDGGTDVQSVEDEAGRSAIGGIEGDGKNVMRSHDAPASVTSPGLDDLPVARKADRGSAITPPHRESATPRSLARDDPATVSAAARGASGRQEPAVRVTIGRIEVRAVMGNQAGPPALPPALTQRLSLDAYLKEREERGR